MKLSPLPNTVVHLKTQAEYDEYMQMCEDAGWKWRSGRSPKKGGAAFHIRIRPCVDVKNGFGCSSFSFPKELGFTILTLPELKAKFAPKKKAAPKKKPKPTSFAITSPDQLKHGMRVTCEMRDHLGEMWQTVDDAKISIDEKRKMAYICQNVIDGVGAEDRLGYKRTWLVLQGTGKWNFDFKDTVRNLRAVDSSPKPDTWHQDAVVYRRGADWITAEKVCVDGKEYTTEELKAQEAKFRAVRRAKAKFFPTSK